MTYIEPVEEVGATGAVAEIYAMDRDAAGRMPNYTRAFSHRPDVYLAWKGLVGAIMGGMDHRRYELATVAAAQELRSSYCSLAHGRILADRYRGGDGVLDLVAGGDTLDETDRAIVSFARKVARRAPDVTGDDVAALRAVGLDDKEITDVVVAVAARCFFSTALDALGTSPDASFADLDPALLDVLVVGRPIADSE